MKFIFLNKSYVNMSSLYMVTEISKNLNFKRKFHQFQSGYFLLKGLFPSIMDIYIKTLYNQNLKIILKSH